MKKDKIGKYSYNTDNPMKQHSLYFCARNQNAKKHEETIRDLPHDGIH